MHRTLARVGFTHVIQERCVYSPPRPHEQGFVVENRPMQTTGMDGLDRMRGVSSTMLCQESMQSKR